MTIDLDIKIVVASANDIKFIDHLQRKNADALSFYPNKVFEREVQNRRVLLAIVNGEPAGYIYHGAFGSNLKIHQACIEYDLRGQLYGKALVEHINEKGKNAGIDGVVLRCGSDIEANGFWQHLGFECVRVDSGGARRMRNINVWHLPLTPTLFELDSVEPSQKQQSNKDWLKARTDGATGNRFVRGRRLQEYRDLVMTNFGRDDG